ncbi:MAG TPA: SDR family NAD(P)-dependent oxidoreductase [Kofleriaceae bacterium]|nr:SDR family NAD(P)-dependent oxidoreductase [Kofleriaceae bacterium]
MTNSAQIKTAAIVGVGPGLGRALALRFARGGLSVGLLARGQDAVAAVHAEVEATGARAGSYACDTTDEASVRGAFAKLSADLGAPDVLVYNAGAFEVASVLDITPADLERTWKTNCLGGLIASQAVLPAMLREGRGTILFSGATASLRGGARFAHLAVGKFGLRALAQSMARELGPRGVHVAHVLIDAVIDTPRIRARFADGDPSKYAAPAALAESYWHLYTQDPSAWTHELDLRPSVEKF